MGPARWSLPAALLLLLALAAGGAEAQDITPPYFMVSWNDLTFEATSSAGAFVDFSSQVSAADDSADTFVVTCTPAKFTLFPMGNTSVECTATDSSGNQAYEQFVITVVDTTPPVLVNVPGPNLVIEATDYDNTVATYTLPTAMDVVDPSPVVVCTPSSGSNFTFGTTVVTCAATDLYGNQQEESFNVTVVDTTPPTLDIPPSPLTIEANAIRGAYVQWEGRVNATDLIDAAPEVECDSPSGGGFLPMGTSTVNCTATDEAGNAAWAMFDVQVVDTTLPVFFPVDYTMEANVFAGALVNATDLARGTVLDIADPDPVVSCDPPAGILFALGSTTNVSCTVTDASGNQANATFQVLVVDTTPPLIITPGDILMAKDNALRVMTEYIVSATDIASIVPEITCNPPSPFYAWTNGTWTVTCRAEDTTGNIATATFNIRAYLPCPTYPGFEYHPGKYMLGAAMIGGHHSLGPNDNDITFVFNSCHTNSGCVGFRLDGGSPGANLMVESSLAPFGVDANIPAPDAPCMGEYLRTLPCPGGAAADAAGYLFHQGTDVDTGNSTVDLVCFFHGGAGSESVADLGEMCDSTPECAAFTVRRNSTTAAAAVEICLVVISNGTTPAELALTSDTQPFMFQSCMGIYVRNDVQTGPSTPNNGTGTAPPSPPVQTGPSSPNGTATNSGSSCSPAVLVFNETAGPTSGHLTSDYGLIPGSDAFAAFLPPRGPVPGGDPAAWLRPYESRTRCAWLFNAGINPGAYASGTTIVQATKLTVRFLSINSPFDRLEVWSLRSSITTPEQLNAVLTHLAANQSSISPEAAALLVNPTAPYAALSGLARDGNLLPIVMYGSFIMYLRTDTVGSAPGFWVEYETQPSSGHLGEMNTQIHIQNDMYHDNSFSSLAVHGSGPCGRRLLFVQQPLFQQGIWVTDCRNDADPVV